MSDKPRRTLKRAVRLHDLKVISCDELINLNPDSYHQIRRTTTHAHNNGEAAYVCELCGFAVYAPREPTTRLPFWRHYGGAPEYCPWWTGKPRSIGAVSASQFKGQQESPLHRKLKEQIADSLKLDSLTENGSVVLDQNLIGRNGHRRPDVRATYDGKKIAVELQLSNTQLPIILQRENFYKEENRYLIWVTWNLNPLECVDLSTAFEDIYYSHNKNIFSIDEETTIKSRESKTFLIRVHWKRDGAWNSTIVGLSSLIWPASGLPYLMEPEKPWHHQFRERWRLATTTAGTHWRERDEMFGELVTKLQFDKVDARMLDAVDLPSLLNFILSFVSGEVIGSRQRNLLEVANTFLASPRRHRFARIARKVISMTDEEILQKDSVKRKLEFALKTEQDHRDTVIGKIVLSLFPEIFQVKASA